MNKTIFLDLDGVFANFEKRFKEIVGFEYKENPTLAWSILDKEENLFLGLEPIDNAKNFFDVIYAKSIYEVKILTALPLLTNRLITSPSDKRNWVAKYLNPEIQVICSDGWRDKKNFCKSGDILVDDMLLIS